MVLCAWRFRLFKRYPIVFTYVFAAILLELFMNVVKFKIGTDSLGYGYLYVGRSLITISLASAVILSIFFFYRPFSIRKDWHLAVVPALLAVFILSDSRRIWFYFRLLDIGYATLTYVGVVAVIRMHRTREVILGWNLTMVLLALTLPAAIYSSVFVVYTLGLNVSKEDANLWMNGISVAAWIILAVGMTEYSPPLRVPRVPRVPPELDRPQAHSDKDKPNQQHLKKVRVDLCGSC